MIKSMIFISPVLFFLARDVNTRWDRFKSAQAIPHLVYSFLKYLCETKNPTKNDHIHASFWYLFPLCIIFVRVFSHSRLSV